MGILEQMRSGSDSTFMQVVFALVVVSFIGWYAIPQGDKSNVVATVNGVMVLDTEFRRAYGDQLRAEEMRYGRTLSDAEQKEVSERVRQQLIEDEVLLQEARRIGLEVSDTEVARVLLDMRFLRNESDKFDEEIYQRFLKRNQFTRADFEERVRHDLLRSKLRGLVFMGASISEPALREAFVESETKVDIEYVKVRPSAFNDDVVITPEDRAAWLATNGALVDQSYERDFDRLYNHPEQVRLRMIRLAGSDALPVGDLLQRANQLRERIEKGEDFADLARRWSEDPTALEGGDLGLRPVQQLSTEIAEAVREVEVGALSRAVTTDLDVRVFRVEERLPPRAEQLDEVRDAIADRLIREERVPALAAAFAEEQLLPQWKAAGRAPTELLATKGLAAATTGPIPAKAEAGPFSPPPAMMKAARTTPPGQVFPEIYEAGGVLWVGALRDRLDADLALFEAQRDTIRDQVLMERRVAFYTGWVSDVKSRARIK